MGTSGTGSPSLSASEMFGEDQELGRIRSCHGLPRKPAIRALSRHHAPAGTVPTPTTRSCHRPLRRAVLVWRRGSLDDAPRRRPLGPVRPRREALVVAPRLRRSGRAPTGLARHHPPPRRPRPPNGGRLDTPGQMRATQSGWVSHVVCSECTSGRAKNVPRSSPACSAI